MSAPLDLFDINVAVGPPKKPTPVTPHSVDELLADMDRFGIGGALVAHNDALERGVHEGNAKGEAAIDGHDRLVPAFAAPMHTAIDYPDPDAAVTDLVRRGARAVRITPPPYHGDLCEPWALGPFWEALERRRVPVLLDRSALGVYPDQPAHGFTAANIHALCCTFPDLPMVLVRANFSAVRVLVPLLRECPNLYTELSFFTAHRGVEFLAEHVGPGRLVFGSGWPWGSAGPGVAAIRYSGLAHTDQQAIAGDNARSLLSAVVTDEG